MTMTEINYTEDDLGQASHIDLDNKILTKWRQFMNLGYFRYGLDGIQSRVVEGKFGYIAQKQLNRSVLRRPPQAMLGLQQEFDPEKFNFTKIVPEKELICRLKKSSSAKNGQGEDTIVSNVSPIDDGHCLLLPHGNLCLPQVLTLHAVELALEVMLLSTNPNIRICFNSLCAFASVNHLHWHLYYLCNKLYIQDVPLQPLDPLSCVFTFPPSTYPAQGWIFLLPSPEKLQQVAGCVYKLTHWLTQSNIAHNVFMVRGAGSHGGGTGRVRRAEEGECSRGKEEEVISDGEETECIRVFVWARESVVGAKDPGEFVMAVCELSGQILLYREDKFDTITEDEIAEAQKEATHRVFSAIQGEVEQLFLAS